MKTTGQLTEALDTIPELSVRAKPNMTSMAIVSNDKNVSILAVADVMDGYGWKMERQQLPDSLHLTMMPHHAHVIDKLIGDLKKSVQEIKANPSLNNTGTTGMYGLVAAIPDKSIVKDFIKQFFSSLYTTEPNSKSIVEDNAELIQK